MTNAKRSNENVPLKGRNRRASRLKVGRTGLANKSSLKFGYIKTSQSVKRAEIAEFILAYKAVAKRASDVKPYLDDSEWSLLDSSLRHVQQKLRRAEGNQLQQLDAELDKLRSSVERIDRLVKFKAQARVAFPAG